MAATCDPTKLIRNGSSANSSGPMLHSYDGSAATGATDTSAQIRTANFFLAVWSKLKVGDFIFCTNGNTPGGTTIVTVLTCSVTGVTVKLVLEIVA